MEHTNTQTNMFSISIVTILWWLAIWYLIEEAIVYVTGNKKHLKAIICISIIMVITAYCYLNPNHNIRV